MLSLPREILYDAATQQLISRPVAELATLRNASFLSNKQVRQQDDSKCSQFPHSINVAHDSERQAKDCDRKLFRFVLFCFSLLSQYTLAAHSGATLLPDISEPAGTYAQLLVEIVSRKSGQIKKKKRDLLEY